MDIATRPDKPNGARATGVRPGPPAGLVPAAAGSFRPVTVRAVAIACALMPPLALWVIQAELVLDSGYPTAISLFYHVTFAILAIAAINLWVEKRWPRAALSGGEIMTIYLMLAVAGAFCSHDLLQILVPMLAYPYYNANPQNNWQTLILQYLKPWAVPHDPRVLAGMAVGNSSIYRWTVLGVWLRPLAFWFAFLMVMTGALLSLNLFFRQQWTENERLSYPIIHIPMMIATGLRDLLRSRLFWIAFGVAAAIDVVNGFNYLFPSIPRIPIQHAFEFRNYFVERPWNAIANTFINLTPFAIGLTFFIPIDLAFSCWFFFLLYRLELVTAAAIGLSDLPGFPFPRQQGAGGYIALGLLALWGARRHLAAVARTILGRPGGADESHEPLRYRTALLVFIVCFAALVAMGCALGARLPVMVFFFVVFMLYSLAIARMRAELGPPGHDLHNAAPNLLITDALGTHNLGKGDLATFSLFFWFNRAYRAHFSAHSMEGFKIAQLTRITNRAICGAMILASVLGSVVALWAILHLMMVHGYSGRLSGEAYSNEPWNLMASMVSIPLKPNMAATMATVTGIVTALALGALRMKFTWWMWHPVGYATSMSWSMDHLWFCMFLGWLAKLLITRYGGAPAYRKAMPFFVGLVLGEFVVGSLWGIWGALAGHKVYCFWGL